MRALPTIIQGGMGAGVSDWRLARSVSLAGQLGVVAGTALDLILIRRLQIGDACGSMRRALDHLPLPGVAQRIIDRYFVPGGKPPAKRFAAKPILSAAPGKPLLELLIASNFAEVFLAKEGHDHPVGINYLEKIQLPTLPSLFGAMLAGVDYVLMGAGIPIAIPEAIERLAAGRPAELRLDVRDAAAGCDFRTHFDPASVSDGGTPELARPRFLAIIASTTVATALLRKATGPIDGFVVEGHSAGGHNAPPRGRVQMSAEGEPIYGERDVPDLAALVALGLPFWLAGSFGHPQSIDVARGLGAVGIQVGTAFAYCEESGLKPELKAKVLALSAQGEARVFTDPLASPTGFPFKVVDLPDTLSDPAVYEDRKRTCDLGYLRHAYCRPDGTLGWRCSAEPASDFERKGGDPKETSSRKCVCNGLMANIGLGQVLDNGEYEPALVTSGDDVATVAEFLAPGARSYSASDVIRRLIPS
ncbi:MAG: nitronate monooxygenase [bacterium]|nr:nitronate monooxygenase [bacterium]